MSSCHNLFFLTTLCLLCQNSFLSPNISSDSATSSLSPLCLSRLPPHPSLQFTSDHCECCIFINENRPSMVFFAEGDVVAYQALYITYTTDWDSNPGCSYCNVTVLLTAPPQHLINERYYTLDTIFITAATFSEGTGFFLDRAKKKTKQKKLWLITIGLYFNFLN